VSQRPLLLATAAFVFGSMLIEAQRARRNERRQRARGGIEPADDVYAVMQWAYPGIFLAMFAEGLWREPIGASIWIGIGLTILATAKLLKWWAILSLGAYWTFRVIVVPGTAAVRNGPYRVLRHPNYVGVVGEIAGIALAANARISGPLAMLLFGALLLRRISVENRALDAILRQN
jgi:methyltransferase